MSINTVLGPIEPEQLGRTLIHEHANVGFPGWESDSAAPITPFADLVESSVLHIVHMQEAGFSTYVDPVPNDMARNVDLLKAIADRTGFNIIFATGLYHHNAGGTPYWKMVMALDPDAGKKITDLFVSEIQNGVGTTGLKPGVIKVATAEGDITAYEEQIIRAAGRASALTGIPIITHTEGQLGPQQLALIAEEGGNVGRVMVGHSDESADPEYHMSIVDAGSYIGFDRFGNAHAISDEQRVQSVLALRDHGQLSRLLVSSDSVWHWEGGAFPPAILTYMQAHFANGFDRVPNLLAAGGLSEADLDTIFVDNPRRFLTGEPASH